jgi:hypothetical protein
MSVNKTYFDIIISDSVVNILSWNIGDHNHVKITVNGLFNIFLIDIGDKIVINYSEGILSFIKIFNMG